MKISACMIVKNEEKVLEKTLPILSAGVDEIILVDTGSSDNTIALAEKFGARVYYFKWIDDFSAARNASLACATGDYILWVDADEFIKLEDLKTLRAVLDEGKEKAYQLPIYECKFGEEAGASFYFRIKVFRNHKGFHFERPFNEQVYTVNGGLLDTSAFLPNVKIAHWGRDLASDKMKVKKERNFRILRESIEKSPKDSFYRFLLANNYLDIKDYENAFAEYGRVIELLPEGVLAATAHIRRAKIHIEKQQYDAAYTELKEAARLEPWNAEAYNQIGAIYLLVGNTQKAIQVLEYSSRLPLPKGAVAGFDVEQYAYQPHCLLGNAYMLNGEKEKALDSFRKAFQFRPDRGLIEKLEKLEKEVELNG